MLRRRQRCIAPNCWSDRPSVTNLMRKTQTVGTFPLLVSWSPTLSLASPIPTGSFLLGGAFRLLLPATPWSETYYGRQLVQAAVMEALNILNIGRPDEVEIDITVTTKPR